MHFIDSRGTWSKKWYGQYRSDRTVSGTPVMSASIPGVHVDRCMGGSREITKALESIGAWADHGK